VTTTGNQSFPTFLGIGVPKAGSTWVCEILGSHPEVLMASRKEVHYFDRNFEKGPDWYARFFASEKAHSAAGEFTTHYLFDERVPSRIRTVPSVERLLLLLRNPVERAISHYRFRCQVDNFRGTFSEFLSGYPEAVDWGRYASHLAPWLDEFERERILILVYEDAVRDVPATKSRLGRWLGVDPGRFPGEAGLAKTNETLIPKHRRAYALATRQAQFLRRHDLDRLLDLGRKAGAKRVLARGVPAARDGSSVPSVTGEERARLWEVFAPEVDRLERMAALDLSGWKSTNGLDE
jgi:hypothetical protein